MHSGARGPVVAGTQQKLLPWGYKAAFAACAFNAIWLACMIYLQSLGSVAVQAQTHPGIFRLSVGSALLLTLMQVPILLAFTALAAQRRLARALVGGAFYALYVPINVIAYFSYGRLAPIVHSGAVSGESVNVVADLVQIGHPLGLTGNLPILGYAILGIAWCGLSSALWFPSRLWRVAVIFLFASGALSIVGGFGAFVGSDALATCCLAGGVVSFPALALLGAAMWRQSLQAREIASPAS